MLANPTRTKVPTMALAMPPPASPTGLGRCTRNPQSSEAAPWRRTFKRISASGMMTMSAQAQQQAETNPLLIFRH